MIVAATSSTFKMYEAFFPVFVSKIGVSVYPRLSYFIFEVYQDRRDSRKHRMDRACTEELDITLATQRIPSPKAKLAILVEEYIGLMKFIPSPATEDKIQI